MPTRPHNGVWELAYQEAATKERIATRTAATRSILGRGHHADIKAASESELKHLLGSGLQPAEVPERLGISDRAVQFACQATRAASHGERADELLCEQPDERRWCSKPKYAPLELPGTSPVERRTDRVETTRTAESNKGRRRSALVLGLPKTATAPRTPNE